MARNLYGCTSADFTLTESGRVVAGATATVWTARTGGTQITDLTDLDGDPITLVTSDADGGIRFYGVDGDKDTYWLDTGTGARIAVRPADLTGEIGPTPDLTIGTVTTGSAAATLTGTSEAPVLNLTLPSAGANGVDTAAIQDGAVTAAKLGSDVRIGNLLTANQASATDTDAATTGFIAAVGCTFASTTAQAAAGTRSLSFTSSAGGALSGTALVNNIEAGYEYTVTVKSRAATTARPVHIYVTWLTEAAGYISAVDATGAITNSASDWTTLRATLVAPANAAKAYFEMYVDASATNEVHYWDCLGMWAGVAGTWRMPGSVVPDAGEVSHIACALANGGAPDYWQPIEDADHAPVGVSHCETAGGKIRLYYAHPTKRVGALVVTGDEVLAGTLNCGASVGLSYADIWLKDLTTGGNVDPTTAGLNAGENLWVIGIMR